MKIRISSKTKRQLAATLAEVMVAIAVMAILFVSLFAGFSFGFNVIKSTREDLRATQIMMQKIEGLRLCTWSELTNQCPFNFSEMYATLSGTNYSATTYNGTVTISQNNNLPLAYRGYVELITVTVTWKTSRGDRQAPLVHTRSIQTQAAYYGLQNYLYGRTNSI